MDTRLENSHLYNIVEPWTIGDNDISHHLHDTLGVNYTMRGTSSDPDSGINSIVYTAYITDEDALHIKLVFPKVFVRPCKVAEKVST